MAILCVLSSCANNALMLLLSISINACLVLSWDFCCLIFWVYLLVVAVVWGVMCGACYAVVSSKRM